MMIGTQSRTPLPGIYVLGPADAAVLAEARGATRAVSSPPAKSLVAEVHAERAAALSA